MPTRDQSEFTVNAARGVLQPWNEGEMGPGNAMEARELSMEYEWASPPPGGVCPGCNACGPMQVNPDPTRYYPMVMWVHKNLDPRVLAGRDVRVPALLGHVRQGYPLPDEERLTWGRTREGFSDTAFERRAVRAIQTILREHPGLMEVYEAALIAEGQGQDWEAGNPPHAPDPRIQPICPRARSSAAAAVEQLAACGSRRRQRARDTPWGRPAGVDIRREHHPAGPVPAQQAGTILLPWARGCCIQRRLRRDAASSVGGGACGFHCSRWRGFGLAAGAAAVA